LDFTASHLLRAARRHRWPFAGVVLVLTIVVVVVAITHSSGPVVVAGPREHDVTAWAPPGTPPLSDAAAAALVTRQPENRPGNTAANDYVPTDAQLAAFHAAQDRDRDDGAFDPLTRFVTGRPGIRDPSTDDLIQWASHKWGIPTNWIRAQLVVESDWNQSQLGDRRTVDETRYRTYPRRSRIAGTDAVYESLGIAQVKWLPSEAVGIGTEPLRWESTAFNLDYYAATLRYYYDGYATWASPHYRAGEAWSSVGGWYSPAPWDNPGARAYIGKVRAALAGRAWTEPGF
jgi:hypothetical protein